MTILIPAWVDGKIQPIEKIIYSLGIRHVGQGTAKLISKNFKSSNDLISKIKELENDNKREEFIEDLSSINGL